MDSLFHAQLDCFAVPKLCAASRPLATSQKNGLMDFHEIHWICRISQQVKDFSFNSLEIGMYHYFLDPYCLQHYGGWTDFQKIVLVCWAWQRKQQARLLNGWFNCFTILKLCAVEVCALDRFLLCLVYLGDRHSQGVIESGNIFSLFQHTSGHNRPFSTKGMDQKENFLKPQNSPKCWYFSYKPNF